MDIVFHYPPELMSLLIDTLPLLCRSKKDILLFFKGAGVPVAITQDVSQRLKQDPSNISKYEIARLVFTRLNEQGEQTLRERREVLKRVVEFEDFSTCWPADQLKAKGLVSEIRRVVDVKDSFTRMKQEKEAERKHRQADHLAELEKKKQRQAALLAIKNDLFALFRESDPHKRGKSLEGVLNRLFKENNLLVAEDFVLREEPIGVFEQIDGVIEIDGELYLTELKWWKDSLGPGEVSQHLVRVFNRGCARGIFISASDFTPAAIQTCKESLQRSVFVLCKLEEIVSLLEQEKDLRDFLKTKIHAAILEKKPLYEPLKS